MAKISQRRALVVLVMVWVALWAGPCLGWVEEAVDKAHEKVNLVAGDAKAEEVVHEPEEKAQSWRDWAVEKFPHGVGGIMLERKTSENVIEESGEAASRATDTINSAASDATKYASSKIGDPALGLDFGLERAANVYDQVKRRINFATNEVSDEPFDPKESIEEGLAFRERDPKYEGKGETKEGNEKGTSKYEKAKENVQDSYKNAEEKMTIEAKDTYEADKEKASGASGDLGKAMRDEREEL